MAFIRIEHKFYLILCRLCILCRKLCKDIPDMKIKSNKNKDNSLFKIIVMVLSDLEEI